MTTAPRNTPKFMRPAVMNNLAIVCFLLLIAPNPTQADCQISFDCSNQACYLFDEDIDEWKGILRWYYDNSNFPVSISLPPLTYDDCDSSEISQISYDIWPDTGGTFENIDTYKTLSFDNSQNTMTLNLVDGGQALPQDGRTFFIGIMARTSDYEAYDMLQIYIYYDPCQIQFNCEGFEIECSGSSLLQLYYKSNSDFPVSESLPPISFTDCEPYDIFTVSYSIETITGSVDSFKEFSVSDNENPGTISFQDTSLANQIPLHETFNLRIIAFLPFDPSITAYLDVEIAYDETYEQDQTEACQIEFDCSNLECEGGDVALIYRQYSESHFPSTISLPPLIQSGCQGSEIPSIAYTVTSTAHTEIDDQDNFEQFYSIDDYKTYSVNDSQNPVTLNFLDRAISIPTDGLDRGFYLEIYLWMTRLRNPAIKAQLRVYVEFSDDYLGCQIDFQDNQLVLYYSDTQFPVSESLPPLIYTDCDASDESSVNYSVELQVGEDDSIYPYKTVSIISNTNPQTLNFGDDTDGTFLTTDGRDFYLEIIAMLPSYPANTDQLGVYIDYSCNQDQFKFNEDEDEHTRTVATDQLYYFNGEEVKIELADYITNESGCTISYECSINSPFDALLPSCNNQGTNDQAIFDEATGEWKINMSYESWSIIKASGITISDSENSSLVIELKATVGDKTLTLNISFQLGCLIEDFEWSDQFVPIDAEYLVKTYDTSWYQNRMSINLNPYKGSDLSASESFYTSGSQCSIRQDAKVWIETQWYRFCEGDIQDILTLDCPYMWYYGHLLDESLEFRIGMSNTNVYKDGAEQGFIYFHTLEIKDGSQDIVFDSYQQILQTFDLSVREIASFKPPIFRDSEDEGFKLPVAYLPEVTFKVVDAFRPIEDYIKISDSYIDSDQNYIVSLSQGNACHVDGFSFRVCWKYDLINEELCDLDEFNQVINAKNSEETFYNQTQEDIEMGLSNQNKSNTTTSETWIEENLVKTDIEAPIATDEIEVQYTAFFGEKTQIKLHFADPKAIKIKENEPDLDQDVEVLGLKVRIKDNDSLSVVKLTSTDYYKTGFAWVTISLDGFEAFKLLSDDQKDNKEEESITGSFVIEIQDISVGGFASDFEINFEIKSSSSVLDEKKDQQESDSSEKSSSQDAVQNQQSKFKAQLAEVMDLIRISLEKSTNVISREIIDDEEDELQIKPVLRKINQAGIVYIDFEPREVQVPDDWQRMWDLSIVEKMSEEDRFKYEQELKKILSIEFVKNSEELDQQYFFSNLTSFTENGVRINLDFSDPLLVSAGNIADKVRIKMLKSYFLKPVDGKQIRALASIDEEDIYFIIDEDIPAQMNSEAELAALEDSLDGAMAFLQGQFVISFILNIGLNGVMSQLWGIFNTLQIILALPLLQIMIPGNMQVVLDVMKQIINFQIVDQKTLYNKLIIPILGEPDENEDSEDVEDAELDQKEDKSNLKEYFEGQTLLAGILFSVIVILVITSLIGLLYLCKIKVLPRCCPCFKKLVNIALAKLMFNSLLRACMQTFLMTCIGLWYSLKVTSVDSKEGIISLIMAIFIFSYIFGFPIFSWKFLHKKKDQLRDPKFKMKYDSLYLNLDYYKKTALPNTSLFFLRRILFAALIVYCTSSIVLQIFLADILSTLMLVYFITVAPMNDSLSNWIQITNEIVVLVSVWLMFHFTEYVKDPATRYLLAFNFLYFIASDIILNIAVLIFTIIKKIYLSCRSCFANRRAKKIMEQKTQAEIEKKNELQQVNDSKRRKQIITYFSQSSALNSSGIKICGSLVYLNKIPPTPQQAHEEEETTKIAQQQQFTSNAKKIPFTMKFSDQVAANQSFFAPELISPRSSSEKQPPIPISELIASDFMGIKNQHSIPEILSSDISDHIDNQSVFEKRVIGIDNPEDKQEPIPDIVDEGQDEDESSDESVYGLRVIGIDYKKYPQKKPSQQPQLEHQDIEQQIQELQIMEVANPAGEKIQDNEVSSIPSELVISSSSSSSQYNNLL